MKKIAIIALIVIGTIASSCERVDPNFTELPEFQSVEVTMFHYTFYEDGKIVGGENLVDALKDSAVMSIVKDDSSVSFDELRTVINGTDTVSYFIHEYTPKEVPEKLVLFEQELELHHSGLIPDRYSFLTYLGDDVKLHIAFRND